MKESLKKTSKNYSEEGPKITQKFKKILCNLNELNKEDLN